MFGRFCFRVAPFRDVKPLTGCPEISQTRRQWFWGAGGKLDLGKSYWTLVASGVRLMPETLRERFVSRAIHWPVGVLFDYSQSVFSVAIFKRYFFDFFGKAGSMVWLGVDPFCFIIYIYVILFANWNSFKFTTVSAHSQEHQPCSKEVHVARWLNAFHSWALRTEKVQWYTCFLASKHTRLTHCKISRKSSLDSSLGTGGPTTDGSLCWSHGPSDCFSRQDD